MTITNYQDPELLTGVAAIARWFGWTLRKTNYQLSTGQLPCAFKIGNRWHMRPPTGRAWLAQMERKAGHAQPSVVSLPVPLPADWAACAWPMPTSLLNAACYLAGDPGLRGRPREFAENLRDLLLRGLDIGEAHRTQLLELYVERHAINTETCRGRREATDA